MPGFLGDLPTWITTIAVALAVAQYLADRARRRHEADRESKAQATGLTAWAVTDPTPDARRYGVMLRNDSGSTFHGVTVDVRLHAKQTERPVELTILPPGEYVVWRTPPGSDHTWEFPQDAKEHGRVLRPYMNSAKYAVLAMHFSDHLGQRWRTDGRAVLARAA